MKKIVFLCTLMIAASPAMAKESPRHHAIRDYWRVYKVCMKESYPHLIGEACDEMKRIAAALESDGCTLQTSKMDKDWHCQPYTE